MSSEAPLSPPGSTSPAAPVYARPGAGPKLPIGHPQYTFPLSVELGRVEGAVSEFRSGFFTMHPEGILIDGSALLPRSTRALVIVGSALVGGLLFAAVLVEYVIRQKRLLELSWDQVDAIVLEPTKMKACLVYRQPDKPGKPDRVESLALKMLPNAYTHFVDVARYFAPNKVQEGKIKGPTSTAGWIILGVFVLLILVLIFAAVLSGGN